ncbi:hypothetical protein LLG39_15135 [bacterium]|nr:hypothetical protein [bacterium]
MRTVLAIDPGRCKCGIAVVRSEAGLETLYRQVVETSNIVPLVSGLMARFHPDVVIIGNGTTSARAAEAIAEIGIARVEFVDEKNTTLLARKRYFQENPPRGLRKLIPISLQTPSHPCDDYAAVILAEQYLSR